MTNPATSVRLVLKRQNRGCLMPRNRLVERRLPPAVITADLLRRIDKAIPDILRTHTTWDISLGNVSVRERYIDILLRTIENDKRFVELFLEVLDDDDTDISFMLGCSSGESWISYTSPDIVGTNGGSGFLSLADEIERAFIENRRRLGLIRRSPEFRLGKAPLPLMAKLDWTQVTQDVLSRIVAHTLTGVVGFGLGLIAGLVLTSD